MHGKCTHTCRRLRRQCPDFGCGSAAFGEFVDAAPPRFRTCELRCCRCETGVMPIAGVWLSTGCVWKHCFCGPERKIGLF